MTMTNIISVILLIVNSFCGTLTEETTVTSTANNYFNVAEGKPTNQSTTTNNGHSYLAVDGNEVPSGLFFKGSSTEEALCTHTAGETTPWWTVDLFEEFLVDRVIFHNRAEGGHSRLHDFDIRIGNNDIAKVERVNERFILNPVCASYENEYLQPGRTEVYCHQPLVGRHVSVQIFQLCKLESCISDAKIANILTLCEVQVFGTPISNCLTEVSVESDVNIEHFTSRIQLEVKRINLALGKPTSQSSTYLQSEAIGGFSYLVVDGNKALNGRIKRIEPLLIPQCSHTATSQQYPWWRVDLLEEYIVDKVVLFNRGEGFHTRLHDFEIRVGNKIIGDKNQLFTQNELCTSFVDSFVEAGKTEIQCKKLVVGRHVSIQIIKLCTLNSCIPDAKTLYILTLCEVQVFGVQLQLQSTSDVNLALLKPTFQSTTAQNWHGSLAVDGNQNEGGRFYHPVTHEPQCSHTHGEPSPWWYVDIMEAYTVDRVVIYNRAEGLHSRLHDFEIRVGSKSIPENELCAAFMDQFLGVGKTEIRCKKPVVGRFVSVQIVKLCSLESCIAEAKTINMLTLCEVEVYGRQMTTSLRVNLAARKPTAQSSTAVNGTSSLAVDGNKVLDGLYYNPVDQKAQCTHTSTEDGIYTPRPWWFVDLIDEYIVDTVVVYNRAEQVHARLHDIEIRVGSKTIEENSLCASYVDKYLESGRTKIQCTQKLVGRYVSIQIIDEKVKTLITLCEVEVFGVSLPKAKSSVNVALKKPTDQSSISDARFVSSLAVDGHELPDGVFYKTVTQTKRQCSHTDASEKFPWWSVDLLDDYIVNTIVVYNRGEGYHSRLHDIEIRIGNYNIKTTEDSGNELFTKNPLCESFIDKFLPEGKTEIKCRSQLIGRYVSIQITKLCTLDSCVSDAKVQNYLNLCEVEVFGQSVPKSLSVGYPFLDLHLDEPMTINGIQLLTASKETNIAVPNFEIRIGNEPITSDYTRKHFKLNKLCSRFEDGHLTSGVTVINCNHQLFGDYVTLQVTDNCKGKECKLKINNMSVIRNMKISGYGNSTTSNLISEEKETSQSSTEKHRGAHFASDGRTSPISEISSLTKPEKHPWWQTNLQSEYIIDKVVIFLPGNGENAYFHDFYILVTNSNAETILNKGDIKIDSSTPTVCASAMEGKIYQKGENTFSCVQKITGSYVIVVIYNEKSDNILGLSEVQVWGCEG